MCTGPQITDIIGWVLQLWFFFSSLPEFCRSEDRDAADLSSKVIVLFFALIYFAQSFTLAPGAKIHILQAVVFSAMCLPTVLFLAMLYLSSLWKFSQFCLPCLSSNNKKTHFVFIQIYWAYHCGHTIVRHTWKKTLSFVFYFCRKCLIFMLMRLTTLWHVGHS